MPISGKYCPLFASNASVTVNYDRSDEEREIAASFSCNRGYRLTGRDSDVMSCDRTGRWEGRRPNCQRKAVSSSWNHFVLCLVERKYHTSSFLHWKTKQDKKQTYKQKERNTFVTWTIVSFRLDTNYITISVSYTGGLLSGCRYNGMIYLSYRYHLLIFYSICFLIILKLIATYRLKKSLAAMKAVYRTTKCVGNHVKIVIGNKIDIMITARLEYDAFRCNILFSGGNILIELSMCQTIHQISNQFPNNSVKWCDVKLFKCLYSLMLVMIKSSLLKFWF